EGQRGGEEVDLPPEDGEGGDLQREGEDEGPPRLDAAAGDGALGGALHLRVALAVEVVVERRRAGGRQRAAQERDGDEVRAGRAGEEHRRGAAEDQEEEDAGLDELDPGAEALLELRGPGAAGHVARLLPGGLGGGVLRREPHAVRAR